MAQLVRRVSERQRLLNQSHNQFFMPNLLVGKQPVLEALKSGVPIEKIFVLHHSRLPIVEKIRHEARRKGVPMTEVDAKRFQEITSDEHAQGIAAYVSTKSYVEPEDLIALAAKKREEPFLLILDEIEDPHNLGALIRSAECAGMHGVIIPKHHAATINETVAKTSAGASAHLAVARVTNVAQTLDELKTRGMWIIGGDMTAEKLYDEVDYSGPTAIVVGNEGKGIRRLVKEKCDFLVKIPMYGMIESLNASVSGALLMFEAAKARHRTKK
jgi:23S rRNA (guanosine2251-2'-O)-methyltransferase